MIEVGKVYTDIDLDIYIVTGTLERRGRHGNIIEKAVIRYMPDLRGDMEYHLETLTCRYPVEIKVELLNILYSEDK